MSAARRIAGYWLLMPALLAEPQPLDEAREHLARGRWAEAREAFLALADEHPVAAGLGAAEASLATGELQAARETLETALASLADRDSPEAAPLHAALARCALERGNLSGARAAAETALESAPQQLVALFVLAEVDRCTGRLDEAQQGYASLVRYYNERDGHSVDDLLWIARGAAMHARRHHLSDQYRFLVTELLPEAWRRDPLCWQAHYEAGLLYLEKHNDGEAAKQFREALAINPSAAELHAALGELALRRFDLDEARRHLERAREICPSAPRVAQLWADWHLANFATPEAIEVLETSLADCPDLEATEGRLAAAYILTDGFQPDDSQSRTARLIAATLARNPRPAELFFVLGERLEARMQFAAADWALARAVEHDPRLAAARAAQGMMWMRIGREEPARAALREAFAADPFHVRISNTLKVLEVLDGYAREESEHFVIRYEASVDRPLARLALAALERDYATLRQTLGYELREKVLVEIFCSARGTAGHGWFSARMTGTPFVGTVAATAGATVAMVSPNDPGPSGSRVRAARDKSAAKFHWGRTLRHELVHVINLEQTGFNVPRWFTEGLAVSLEGFPRPQVWNLLLAERVPRRQLYRLHDIQLGFVRPGSSADWQLAYCQAELYIEYLQFKYGADSIARMLAAYRDRLDTAAALAREFQVQLADFEQGYLEYLDRLVQEQAGGRIRAPRAPRDLRRLLAARPQDPALQGEMSLIEWKAGRVAEARKLAESALATQPRQPTANRVLAELALENQDSVAAMAQLSTGLDPEYPDAELLMRLGQLQLQSGDHRSAEASFLLGTRHFPGDSSYFRMLAQVYAVSGQAAPLREALAAVADREVDDIGPRRQLAGLYLADGDAAQAEHWAREALCADVLDVESHRLLAEALWQSGRQPEAREALATAVELAPEGTQLAARLAEWTAADDESP